MFKIKYRVSLLDSKWNPIKKGLILDIIPRKDEYIYYENQYYTVLNVVHNMGSKHDIFIVIELTKKENEEKK